MLRLKRLVPAGAADVYAKLEYLNPGGSVKDRAASGIILLPKKMAASSPAAPLSKPRPATPASVWLSSESSADIRLRFSFPSASPKKKSPS